MDNPVEVIEGKTHVGKIFYDSTPENPREMFDHEDLILLQHRRYKIGDKHSYRSDDYSSWDDFEKQLKKDYDNPFILPVYMYDHSGIAINTVGFNCPWDSGQIGFVLITKAKVREIYQVKRITKKVKEKAYEYLNASITEYGQYLSGQVYGYIVSKKNEDEDGDEMGDGEEKDSCWGFYGLDYCKEEVKSIVDYWDKKEVEDLKASYESDVIAHIE